MLLSKPMHEFEGRYQAGFIVCGDAGESGFQGDRFGELNDRLLDCNYV